MLRFETAGESHGECLVATLDGAACRYPNCDRCGQPRAVAAAAGLRARRAHEDRDRSGAKLLRACATPTPSARPSPSSSGTRIGRTGRKRFRSKTPMAPRTRRSLSRGRARGTPTSPAHSNTTSRMPAISWSGPARVRPRRAWPPAPSPRLCSASSASRFSAMSSRSAACASIARHDWEELVALSRRDEILLGCVDPATEQQMKEVVDQAYRTGDTVGGVFEVVAHGVPPGLGSHITWDSRLDGRLAQAIVSIQAVKGVEIGYAEEGGGLVRLGRAGHHPLRARAAPLHPRRQPRRRARRRHHQRPGRGGARLSQAHLDVAPSARIGGPGYPRAGRWPPTSAATSVSCRPPA